MSYNNGPKITTDGLVLCLDAGNSKSYPGSGNIWYDLSGKNNHAILSGTYEYNQTQSPCIKFNNNAQVNGDGRGIINFNNTGISDNTIECYFKINRYLTTTNTVNMQTSILTSGRHSGCGFARHFGTYANGASGQINSNQAFWYVAGQIDGGVGPNIFVNTIYHLVLTIENLNKKYYVNNTLMLTDTRSTTQFAFSGQWAIANSRCISQNFGVDIDFYCLRIYKKALSATEISNNYNTLKGRFGL